MRVMCLAPTPNVPSRGISRKRVTAVCREFCHHFFASNRKPCKAKERHKRLQVLKCHKLQSAANVLFCPTCSFCFPTFILVFLNICSPSFVSTFPHSCARQPGFGIRVFIRGTVWVSVSVTTQDYALQAARLSSNILIMNISRI